MKTLSPAALALLLAACTGAPSAPLANTLPTGDGATPEGSASPSVSASSSEAPATPPPNESAITLFVDAKSVPCEGEGPMTCLRIRSSASEEWTLLYQSIEGFSFNEGHAYELLVERSEVSNPPAGGSSLRYRLISIVEDRKAP